VRRVYKFLLRLYPSSVRAAFAAEMAAVFEQAAAERRAQGRLPYFRFLAAEAIGLVLGAGGARLPARQPESSLDLRKMRPPDVSCGAYTAALDEVLEAQRVVDFNRSCMQEAIAGQDYVRARFYSNEDWKAREHLTFVRRKYRIPLE